MDAMTTTLTIRLVDPREYGGTPFTAADDLPLPGYGDAVLYDCG